MKRIKKMSSVIELAPVTNSEDMVIVKAIGLLIRIDNKIKNPDVAKQEKELRAEILRYAISVGSIPNGNGLIPITLSMPCGNTRTYESVDALPFEDVPCPCGNPNHWLIKYERANF